MDLHENARNIEQQMKERKIRIEELASRVGMAAPILEQVIRGRLVPGSTLMRKISEALSEERSDSQSAGSSLSSIRFRSRTLNNAERLKRSERIRDAATWIDDYSFLENSLGEKIPYRLAHVESQAPAEAAKAARLALGLSEKTPLQRLSAILEEGGIKVRLTDFGFSKTSGFSVGESDGGPAVIVNTGPGITTEHQVFTIAHEFGHLLLHRDSYVPSIESEHAGEERDANEFAGNFLLPREPFLDAWSASAGLDFVSRVLWIKEIFSVSYQTVLQRLYHVQEGLRLSDLRKRFAIEYRERYTHDLKNYYEPFPLSPLSILPVRYPLLVRQAYEKGIITDLRAREMLTLSPVEMSRRITVWKDLHPMDDILRKGISP